MVFRIGRILGILTLLLCLSVGPAWSAATDAKSKDAPEDPNKPHYVKITPLILPVIGAHGIEQIISLVLVIETPNKAAADAVIELSPRLNDAYVTDLYGTLDRRDKTANGVLDIK